MSSSIKRKTPKDLIYGVGPFGQVLGYVEIENKPIKTSPKSSKQMTVCPTCKVKVRQDRLEKHLRKIHGSTEETEIKKLAPKKENIKKPAQTPPKSSKPMTVCPICKVKVRQDQLEKHLQKKHKSFVSKKQRYYRILLSNAQRLNSSSQPAKKEQKKKEIENKPIKTLPKSSKPMTVCPTCKSPVRQDRLQKHLRKFHGTYHNKSKKKSRAVTPNVQRRNSSSQSVKTRQSYMDYEPYDGSKYIGYMRRENGRFGSFPLHDDYGDESQP